jgi:lysophospholipase L1-like esterase
VSGNTILFDGFGTSKAVDNPYFVPSLRLFAEQEGERRAVLFNNGLHGWHLEDQSDYARAYEDVLVQLLEEFKGTPVMLLLSTPVADTERDRRVQVRNEVVLALAKKYCLPVIDLYSVTKARAELLSPDGVHFLPEGYRLLAEAIVERVKEQLS